MELWETLTIIVNPKRATTANSEGPNFRANRARGNEKRARQIVLNNPPKTDQIVLMLRASPEYPFWDSLYPSKVEAMEAGVPGVLMRIAEIPPDQIAELYTPMSIANPLAGGSQKDIGVNTATAIVAVKPGSVPINAPETTPITR